MVKVLLLIRQLGGLCWYTIIVHQRAEYVSLVYLVDVLFNPIGMLLDELPLQKGRMYLFTKY